MNKHVEIVTDNEQTSELSFLESFRPVRGLSKPRQSLSEKVYRHIVRRIYLKEVDWGKRITELQLAEELKVSTAPVREALVNLQRDGWVETFPNRGTYIINYYDRKKFRQILQLREAVEVGTFYKLAQSKTDRQLKEIENIVEQLERALADNDFLQYRHNDATFHLKATLLVGGPRYEQFFRNLLLQCFVLTSELEERDGLEEQADILMTRHVDVLQPSASHRSIYEAVVSGESQKAAELVTEHITFRKK